MFKTKTYNVNAVSNYIDVSGIVGNNVLIVDRNGIGIRPLTLFGSTTNVTVYTYEWYGIKYDTISAGDYIIIISDILTITHREYTFEFGPNPTVGVTYSVYNDNNIASYKVQSGDTTEDVRNGLKGAIDAASWGTYVSTTSISTNRLYVLITGFEVSMEPRLGKEKYKKGYFCELLGDKFFIYQAEAASAFPVLPAIQASYNYSTLVSAFGTIEGSLEEPNTVYTYSDSSSGSTNIIGAPIGTTVAVNTCVIDESAQKIYFNENLNFGEIIKVFQK